MAATGNQAGTAKEDLRALRILVIALLSGIILFTVISVVINRINGPVWKERGRDERNLFFGVAVILALACWILAKNIYSKKIKKIKEQTNSLGVRLNQYRAALVLYLAPCEGAAIFSIISFFLLGDYKVLIIPPMMIAALFSEMPSGKKLTGLLELDWKDQQEIE